jgi:hypothetical protein
MSTCSKCLSLAKLIIWLSPPTFSNRPLTEEVPVCSQCVPSLVPVFPVWSQCVPSLVPVYSQFGPSLFPVYSQFGPSLFPVCPQFGPSVFPVWSQFIPSLVPVWSQFGPSLFPVWSQFVPSLVPTQSQHFACILWESVLQCCTLICSSIINAIQSLQFTASLNNIHTYYQLSCEHSGLLGCYAEWQVRTYEGYWLSSCLSTAHTITPVFRDPKIMPGPMHTSPDWLARLACLKKLDNRVYKPVSQV